MGGGMGGGIGNGGIGKGGMGGGLGSGAHGMGGRGTNNGGISSDMWAASNGNPSQMSSMSYQQGGGGYGGGGSRGGGINDVARQAQKNLGALASTVQNSEAFGTATKAAAQAGGFLGSWLSTAASQATTLINEGANAATGVATGQRGLGGGGGGGGFAGFGGGGGTSDLRNDLRRNLASAPPAASGGNAFVGFSSEDYQRSHTNGNSGRAATMAAVPGANANSHLNPAQLPSSSIAPVAPSATTTAARPGPRASDLNAGWGGFDDAADTAEPAKDAWGSWD